jgi:hypothetical protein
MRTTVWLGVALMGLPAMAEQLPLPELRIEPTAGGSVFYVRNVASQPLTGFLIELVNYPGSSYSLWQDAFGSEAIAPGVEKRIPVTNMTVGAVPDYVKMQAALYADGSSSGIPEKAAQLVERRRATLETTRELIRRLEKAEAAGVAKEAVASELKQWADSMQPEGKADRNSPAAVLQAARRNVVAGAVTRLQGHSVAETVEELRVSESALAASKPPL